MLYAANRAQRRPPLGSTTHCCKLPYKVLSSFTRAQIKRPGTTSPCSSTTRRQRKGTLVRPQQRAASGCARATGPLNSRILATAGPVPTLRVPTGQSAQSSSAVALEAPFPVAPRRIRTGKAKTLRDRVAFATQPYNLTLCAPSS